MLKKTVIWVGHMVELVVRQYIQCTTLRLMLGIV